MNSTRKSRMFIVNPEEKKNINHIKATTCNKKFNKQPKKRRKKSIWETTRIYQMKWNEMNHSSWFNYISPFRSSHLIKPRIYMVDALVLFRCHCYRAPYTHHLSVCCWSGITSVPSYRSIRTNTSPYHTFIFSSSPALILSIFLVE